ncbi:MAG: hypothetical protein HBSIN02_20280 [Bacteroidia bacterium]|nr:MAG: hypothetical protein HBSIN02_20280 [Bacteroidia bacterium]
MRLNKGLSPRPADWTMYGGGPARTNALGTHVLPPFEFLWEYNAQAGLSATPLVSDSTMIVGTLRGEIQAVDLRTGRRLGYKTLEQPIVGTPALDGSKVILPLSGPEQSLMCLDLAGGREVWAAELGPIESSPLVLGDHVYVTTLRGTVHCLDKDGGNQIWNFDSGTKDHREAIRSSPAVEGRVLAFGSDDHSLYGLDRERGILLWKTPTGGSVFATPLMVDGLVIAGNLAGDVYALDAMTGAVRWTYRTGSKVYASASTSRGTVFIGSANGVLHALDAVSGALRWTFSTGSVIGSSALAAGNLVYVGTLNKRLYALDAATGRERWGYEAEGRIRVSPVLWGDILLVTSEDKYITALKAKGS